MNGTQILIGGLAILVFCIIGAIALHIIFGLIAKHVLPLIDKFFKL